MFKYIPKRILIQSDLHIVVSTGSNEVSLFHCAPKNNGGGGKGHNTLFFRNCETLQNFTDMEIISVIPPVY